MIEQDKPQFRFHDPNPSQRSAEFLLSLFAEAALPALFTATDKTP